MIEKYSIEVKERLLKEIQGLPEPEILKILKLIHFFKEEILEKDKQKDEEIQLFWQSFGSWEDERSPEEIIREIYESRKSTSREINL
jgi:hypothetical protein